MKKRKTEKEFERAKVKEIERKMRVKGVILQ